MLQAVNEKPSGFLIRPVYLEINGRINLNSLLIELTVHLD